MADGICYSSSSFSNINLVNNIWPIPDNLPYFCIKNKLVTLPGKNQIISLTKPYRDFNNNKIGTKYSLSPCITFSQFDWIVLYIARNKWHNSETIFYIKFLGKILKKVNSYQILNKSCQYKSSIKQNRCSNINCSYKITIVFMVVYAFL